MDPPRFWIAPIVAGMAGRIITATVVSPLELVRTNLQANVIADASIDNNSTLLSPLTPDQVLTCL